MTDNLRHQLKEAATKADQHEWTADPYHSKLGTLISFGDIAKGQTIAGVFAQRDAEAGEATGKYVALASPANILDLLETLERRERLLDELTEKAHERMKEIERLRACAPNWELGAKGSTHWEGCWKEHRLCALGKIEELKIQLEGCAIVSQNYQRGIEFLKPFGYGEQWKIVAVCRQALDELIKDKTTKLEEWPGQRPRF